MAVRVCYHTDPACSASWAAEPRLRRLMVEFGDDLEITYVSGGLAREFNDPPALAMRWLQDAAGSGMPVDPRIRAERLLRGLREGFMCHRRKLDGPEALVETPPEPPVIRLLPEGGGAEGRVPVLFGELWKAAGPVHG